MRFALLVVACAVVAVVGGGVTGCKDRNDRPTAVGALLVEWDHTRSDRPSVRAAKLGERRSVNVAHEARMADGSTVRLGIALVTAPVTLLEDGVTKEYLAPVLLTAKLEQNADFTFAEATCAGPHYQMARPTPREMILECRARARKPSADVVLAFDVFGDGRIVDSVDVGAGARDKP